MNQNSLDMHHSGSSAFNRDSLEQCAHRAGARDTAKIWPFSSTPWPMMRHPQQEQLGAGRVNRAFEAVEDVGLSTHDHFKSFVVIIFRELRIEACRGFVHGRRCGCRMPRECGRPSSQPPSVRQECASVPAARACFESVDPMLLLPPSRLSAFNVARDLFREGFFRRTSSWLFQGRVWPSHEFPPKSSLSWAPATSPLHVEPWKGRWRSPVLLSGRRVRPCESSRFPRAQIRRPASRPTCLRVCPAAHVRWFSLSAWQKGFVSPAAFGRGKSQTLLSVVTTAKITLKSVDQFRQNAIERHLKEG